VTRKTNVTGRLGRDHTCQRYDTSEHAVPRAALESAPT